MHAVKQMIFVISQHTLHTIPDLRVAGNIREAILLVIELRIPYVCPNKIESSCA